MRVARHMDLAAGELESWSPGQPNVGAQKLKYAVATNDDDAIALTVFACEASAVVSLSRDDVRILIAELGRKVKPTRRTPQC